MPQGGNIQSGEPESLSQTSWDPRSPLIHPGFVKELQSSINGLLGQLNERILETRRTMSRDGEVVNREHSEIMPEGWAESPGSPLYYMEAAAGYLKTAAEGNVCWNGFPKSEYRQMPGNQWCCDHNPRHCR